MRKNNKFEKYNFTANTNDKTYNEYKNIFTRIKEWVIKFIKFLIYQWTHNRLMFLLVLSLIFILGYYIYVNYIKKENELEKINENTETLNNLVRGDGKYHKKIKKSIPKKHETRCRIILENLFKSPFVTIRPDFLKYPKTGKNLELDMFNSELMIALEYDGVHHRKFTEFFHKSEQDFIEQQERDHYKEERCKELGITLIRVPDTVKYDNLEEYIKNELDKRGIFYFKLI